MNILSQWAQGIDFAWVLQNLLVALAAVLAITVHESAHGLAALWMGDDTAKRMGRISLNPLRHIDPLGLVLLIVAKFGWAKPVPVNMYRFKNPKKGMALTALAGPLSNVLLALLATVFLNLTWLLYEVSGREALYYVYVFFYFVQLINAGLAVFNLIPIPPLDGSKILALVLPQKAHAFLMKYERYGFIVLAALLFFGVLDTPLDFLRSGLINILNFLVSFLFPAL